jgi:hypothetical protein
MTKKMELTYYYNKKTSFVFDNNAIFIPCKIHDSTYLVLYDSKSQEMGVTNGLLTEKIHGNVEFPKCNKTIKLRKGRKTKNSLNHRIIIKSGLKYYDVESDFFHFKNLVGVVTSLSNDTIISKCTSEKSLSKFVINNIILDWENAMLLSFSDTTITLFDTISTYDTTGFTLVKSIFTCSGYTVRLTIDSIEYDFFFNTSNRKFLSLPQDEKHQKGNDMYIADYKEQNVSDTTITQYANVITIGNLDSIVGNIFYTKEITQPVMGMEFISHFDWIIDMYKQKIYVKKIKDVGFK